MPREDVIESKFLDDIDLEVLKSKCKKMNKLPQQTCDWEFEDGKVITLLGCKPEKNI